MSEAFGFIDANISIFVLSLCLISFILLIFCLFLSFRYRKLIKKYKFFMGDVNQDNISVEKLLDYYINEIRKISKEHTDILNDFKKIQAEMSGCLQKIGVVRYNPFDEMGGNLCFTVALLDNYNNGVVFNGIHSRSGSYTYAKPIKNGESSYVLSGEEKEAIDIAKRS